MKKLLISLITSVLTVAVLTGCNNTPEEKENKAPEISGVVENVSITLGQTWDAMEGVTAIDEEDGVLTDKITIESIPAMVLVDGKFTPEEQGEYYITYTVKDSKGAEDTEFTTLNVTRSYANETLYKKYQFSQTGEVDLDGWEASFIEGGAGTLEAKRGKLEFDVTALGTNDNHAQLTKKNVEAEAGVEYELKITMSASKAGKFHFIVNNAAAGWAPVSEHWNVEISTTPTTYSAKYSLAEDNDKLEYLINVGGSLNTDAITFYIDKIDLLITTGNDTESLVFEELFDTTESIDKWGIAKDESVNSSVAVTDGKLVQTIENYSAEGQPWNINLYYISGQNLVKDRKYKVSMDVTVMNEQFYELCFEDISMDWQIRAGFKNGTLTGTSTIEHTFYADMDITGLYIKLAVGKGTTSNVISIDNLRFYEVVGDKETVTESTTFMPNSEDIEWDTYNDNGGVGSIYVEDGKLYYSIAKFGSTDWFNKFFIKKINLEAGALYKIEFKAKADKNIKGFFAFNVFGKWDPRITAEFELTPEETTYTFTTDAELVIAMDFEILFQFGGYTTNVSPALIEFSDISVYQLK